MIIINHDIQLPVLMLCEGSGVDFQDDHTTFVSVK